MTGGKTMMGRGAKPNETLPPTALTPLGERLLALRGKRSTSEVAQAVGLAPIYYRQIELGRRRPSPHLVERLATLFGVDPAVLFALLPDPRAAPPPRPSVLVPEQSEEARAAAEKALDARAVARLLREDKDAAALARVIGWKGTR